MRSCRRCGTLTCKSPREVMPTAYHLSRGVLPDRTSKFARKGFTPPRLFACPAVEEQMGRGYRGAEALLKDAEPWRHGIGMGKVPDHDTLRRAAGVTLSRSRTDELLDVLARWASTARILGLSPKPPAGDGTYFGPRHCSRYFESRRGRGAGGKGRRRRAKGMADLAAGVAPACHLILSAPTGTGSGGEHPHFERILYGAWRRAPDRRFKAAFDAGYDSEADHESARRDMGVRSLIPATVGRPAKGGGTPSGRRWHTRRVTRTKRSRRARGYTQRRQVEAVNSMLKRNGGSALRGKTRASRLRGLRLKAPAHHLMILRR